MRKGLPLFYFLLIFSLTVQGQRDTVKVASSSVQKSYARESLNISVSIYPVPVRDNSFTIKSEKDISFVKITNIIGQDILRTQYNDPQQLIKIELDHQKRGMYLVTIIFTDGLRIVKKIMIEESE
jgi:hypothetical protein